MNESIDTYCGLECGACDYREKMNCGGCVATKGNPFHGGCEVAECAKKRGIRFCGECGEFPCELIERYSNDEEHGDTPKGARIERCKHLKAALVKEAREGINPVSYCGHHCDYCFMGQWCGGCRSGYNCCSFATLFEDRLCPNVSCAKEKGLEGCYRCPELKACQKGYYGVQNEYIAKATALFIREHGETRYTQALRGAIEAGLDYPKSFDATGNVDKALELLETFF